MEDKIKSNRKYTVAELLIAGMILASKYIFKTIEDNNSLNVFLLSVLACFVYVIFWTRECIISENIAAKIAGSACLVCFLCMENGFKPNFLKYCLIVTSVAWLCKRPMLTPITVFIACIVRAKFSSIILPVYSVIFCMLLVTSGKTLTFNNSDQKSKKKKKKNTREVIDNTKKFEIISVVFSLCCIAVFLIESFYNWRFLFLKEQIIPNIKNFAGIAVIDIFLLVIIVFGIKNKVGFVELFGESAAVLLTFPLLALSSVNIYYMIEFMLLFFLRCMFDDTLTSKATDKFIRSIIAKAKNKMQKISLDCT